MSKITLSDVYEYFYNDELGSPEETNIFVDKILKGCVEGIPEDLYYALRVWAYAEPDLDADLASKLVIEILDSKK